MFPGTCSGLYIVVDCVEETCGIYDRENLTYRPATPDPDESTGQYPWLMRINDAQ
jgi:hypothetical protein